jgi:two-component sensor histidine kinase
VPLPTVWGVAFAAATAIGVVDALPLDAPGHAPGGGAIWRALAQDLLPWYGWAALAPLVVMLAERVPLASAPLWRSTLVHLAAGLGLSALKLVLLAPVTAALYGWGAAGTDTWGGVRWLLENRLLTNLVMYGFAATAATAALARRDARERARAELQLLRAQLEPHFLFNALNAVAAYLRVDPPLAERMLARVSELLRLVLKLSAADDVSLEEEIALAERYAEVHRMRFGDGLAFRLDAPADVHAARVPGVVLQPLVENAFRHAAPLDGRGGEVSVRARRDGTRLVLTVSNTHSVDGAGTPDEGSGSALGLANTRARLARLYGADARLTLRREEEATVAEIVLPWRTAAEGDGR